MCHSLALYFTSSLRGAITLPASKSISNRILIMQALAVEKGIISNLSSSDDTQVLVNALRHADNASSLSLLDNADKDLLPTTIDIHGAGTAMRFLTAYFALKGNVLLTGDKRMCHRPISILVDALRLLGADIHYAQKEGYPPLWIKGKTLKGGAISIDASVSSQYITALLLIAPYLQEGLQLTFKGDIISRSYIDITLNMMRACGINMHLSPHAIHIPHQKGYILPFPYLIEPDWSAASYWYALMALSPDSQAKIFLPHLSLNSVQGDKRIAELFAPLGVHTTSKSEGIYLTKQAPYDTPYSIDLSSTPDIIQTVAITYSILQRPFRISGIDNLRIKETDRITALQNELARLNLTLEVNSYIDAKGQRKEILQFTPSSSYKRPTVIPRIRTYNDHRMAMAFAPAAYVYPNIQIENPAVVKKSYPSFWQDLQPFLDIRK